MIDKSTSDYQDVGRIDQETIDLINKKLGKDLPIVPSAIIIGPTNIEHIKDVHKFTYDNYLDEIPNIIADPDYIALHPSGKSIEYIKKYDDNVLVAVRLRSRGPLWVKSCFTIEDFKLEQYIKSGSVVEL